MSFFSKFFLYFLPLISIPIIIHLLGKNRIKTVRFSSLKFLDKLKNDAIKKLKLRQIILLIIRTLLILLIIIFFARPYITSRDNDIYPAKGESLFLLIDNSLSMSEQYQNNSILQNKLIEITKLSKNIKFPISLKIQLATKPNEIIDYGKINNKTDFGKILGKITNSQNESYINEALEYLYTKILDNNIINTNLWIISDFQIRQNLIENLSVNFSKLYKTEKVKTSIFSVNHDEINNAISEVVFPDQIFESNKNIIINTKLKFWQKYLKTKVSLFIQNERVAQNITKNANQPIEFEFIPLHTGTLTGNISIPTDNLVFDNKYYFAFDIPEKLNTLIISNRGQNNTLLEKALIAGKESIIHIQNISPEILSMENLNDYDVLIFYNISKLADSYKNKLENFQINKKGIIYIPGVDCSIADYNNFWHKQIGLPKWVKNLTSSSNSYLKIKNINLSHPIFSEVWQQGNNFQSHSQFFAIPVFQQNKNQKLLMNYNNSTPFLIESNLKFGKALLLAGFLTPQESNLQLSGFFPVLIQQMVKYLTNSNKSLPYYFIGDTLTHQHFQLENISEYSIKTPNKKSYLMNYDDKHNQLYFTNTISPGFYKLYYKDKIIRQFALNINKNETNGIFLSKNKISEIIKTYNNRFAIISSNILDKNFQINKEQKEIFLIFILLLLIAETIIARINHNKEKKD